MRALIDAKALVAPVIVVCGLVAAVPARGNAPPGRYQITTNNTPDDVTDDTVLDVATKLRWQRGVSPPVTWDANAGAGSAQAYCASLNIGAFTTGWRVPQIRELLTIVDTRRLRPALDPVAFPGIPVSPETGSTRKLWTATPIAGASGRVWVVGVGTGHLSPWTISQGSHQSVRCVHAP